MQNRKLLFSISLIALAAIIIGLAWAEQATLTTYYPAPYGVYRNFTTSSKTILATEPGANVGIGTDVPAEKLDVSGNIHATGDICTDQGGGVCLSSAGSGWRYSGQRIKTNVVPPRNWQEIDLSSYVGTARAFVMLKIKVPAEGETSITVRPNGDADEYDINGMVGGGTADLYISPSGFFNPPPNQAGLLVIETDDSGII